MLERAYTTSGRFGCAFRRESYIQEFAYSTSEGPRMRLRMDNLHEGLRGTLTKGELTSESMLLPIKCVSN